MNRHRRFVNLLSIPVLVLVAQVPLTSCGGGGAKAVKSLQKVVSKSGKAANKGAKGIGKAAKYSDDVVRAVGKHNESSSSTTATLKTVTITCSSCAGYGQVNFVDEYGNYAYTGTCPDCEGEGTITKYEYK